MVLGSAGAAELHLIGALPEGVSIESQVLMCHSFGRPLTGGWPNCGYRKNPPRLCLLMKNRRRAACGDGRKRPASGWASLTRTERDVVRLVSEGLANNHIATRLFVSPRTAQSHLAHVCTKLGLRLRVRLAQEAARQA